MSNAYKSQLQENNTSLQNILDTINNLPESGDSSEVELCTVTITDPKAPLTKNDNFHYTTFGQKYTAAPLNQENTIKVIKNTLIWIDEWSSMSSCSDPSALQYYDQGIAIFLITSDCSFTFK